MASSEIIGYEGEAPTPHPKDYHPELNYRLDSPRLRGKNVTHKDFLAHLREKKYPKEVHSDGFLAVSTPAAYVCECGFEGIFASTHCVRCGRIL